jgi:nucleoside phosphorylase
MICRQTRALLDKGVYLMSKVDVLIVTALKEEYEAARDSVPAKFTGNGSESVWTEQDTGKDAPYLIRKLIDPDGATLTFALVRPTRMGGLSAAPIASILVERLKPQCLAMCGVCAGNPDAVTLGDVIIAEFA